MNDTAEREELVTQIADNMRCISREVHRGMPREVAPPTHRAFREYYERKLASDEMYLTAEARYIGHATAFEIPMPAVNQPGKRVHDLKVPLSEGTPQRQTAIALTPTGTMAAVYWTADGTPHFATLG